MSSSPENVSNQRSPSGDDALRDTLRAAHAPVLQSDLAKRVPVRATRPRFVSRVRARENQKTLFVFVFVTVCRAQHVDAALATSSSTVVRSMRVGDAGDASCRLFWRTGQLAVDASHLVQALASVVASVRGARLLSRELNVLSL